MPPEGKVADAGPQAAERGLPRCQAYVSRGIETTISWCDIVAPPTAAGVMMGKGDPNHVTDSPLGETPAPIVSRGPIGGPVRSLVPTVSPVRAANLEGCAGAWQPPAADPGKGAPWR